MTAALLVLFAATAFAQKNQGTVFEKGTLKELLALADEQDKYLFVDVYATWCGPCQIMAKQIFPQQKVGEFFNKTFVNAKFDAEKGDGQRQPHIRIYNTSRTATVYLRKK